MTSEKPISAPAPTSLRLILSLVATALLSGVALSGLFMYTQPMILANQAEATQKAIFQVLPGTQAYQTYALKEGKWVKLEAADEVPDVPLYMGLDADGNSTGFAVPGEGSGFGGTLKLLFGLQPGRNRVVGLQILESLETPGLGDKIEKDTAFVESFKDLAIKPDIELSKKREKPHQVDSISGATISSKAVVRIISDRLAQLPQQFPVAEER